MISRTDLLRRAAAKLRDTAGRVSAGPWCTDEYTVFSDGHKAIVADCLNDEIEEDGQDTWNAYYIALMDPPVALALASLLDAHAESVEEEGPHFTMTSDLDAAFDVARAILREDAP